MDNVSVIHGFLFQTESRVSIPPSTPEAAREEAAGITTNGVIARPWTFCRYFEVTPIQSEPRSTSMHRFDQFLGSRREPTTD